MSKIKRISVTNIKAVANKSADFNGCTALIIGGNNKGKTSFLRSLMDRMRGIKSDIILRQGEKEGKYVMELTNGDIITWDLAKEKDGGTKEKMFLISKDGSKQKVTKEICQYFFPEIFDVDEFLNDAPKEQRKKMQKLANIDFADLDAAYREAYEERTWANKKREEATVIYNSFKNVPDAQMRKEPHTEEIDALKQQIAGMDLHNERVNNFVFKLDGKKATLANNNKIIQQLQEQIKKLQDENMQLETDIDKGDNALKDPKWQLKTEADKTTIKTEITKLEESNKRIEENNKCIAAKNALDNAIKNCNVVQETIDKIERDKAEALKASKLPDGFSFTDDGIEYEGLPFNKQQLSSSRVYIGALKLAALTLGEVKTLHFDASHLDRPNLLEIEKWAKTQGLQLLIERPDLEGGEIEYQIVEG